MSDPSISADIVFDVKRAIDFSNCAVQYDQAGKYPNAIVNYESAIQLIDHILSSISNYDNAFRKLYDFRIKYSLRLDVLRDELENGRSNRTNDKETTLQTQLPDTSSKMSVSVNIKFETELSVEVDTPRSEKAFALEKCPLSLPRQPYWQMRIIRNTILTGGYLTPNLYIPRNIWFQSGVKISGLQIKFSAFEQIYVILSTRILPLEHCRDSYGLRNALKVFVDFSDDLFVIQNGLSKPFPFIHEIDEPLEEPSTTSKSQVRQFTDIVTTLGKNVRKYAETGLQRLGTVIEQKLTEEEISQFTALVSEVCDRCQLLDDWYQFLEQERGRLSEKSTTITTAASSDGTKLSAEESSRLELVTALMTEQHNVSTFMREVVCELLLQDIQQLLAQYSKKMRDSFLALPWEMEASQDGVSHT